ncbi:MAG: uncharacterized LabA/DUF88 family protein/Fe-S-cluster formation regulator IscX/YfhJ [Flavobacteriales bacterium]|jgi:uncharacterized LabA/DUF88 family protein/Fe-S-cluster formation regulator IscX/YfhJ
MSERKELKLAVLIDADNVPYARVKEMLDEVAKFGIPTIKRIYGDWTKQTVSGWKNALLQHAIQPIQQYSYTTGKNATDSAMIIDAMDILHSDKVDGFCLVSSDSDFTRLATRLRESGMFVLGMGQKKTPYPLIVACDKFVYIEILGGGDSEEEDVTTGKVTKKPKADPDKVDGKLIRFLKSSVSDVADDDGWAGLAAVGALLNKKKPDFDPRNYGFAKLTPFIKSLKKHFEVDEREAERGKIKHIYLRIK